MSELHTQVPQDYQPITFTPYEPTEIRRCIMCHLPISTSWVEIFIQRGHGKRAKRVEAIVFMHASAAGCAAERAALTPGANLRDPRVYYAHRLACLAARREAVCANH